MQGWNVLMGNTVKIARLLMIIKSIEVVHVVSIRHICRQHAKQEQHAPGSCHGESFQMSLQPQVLVLSPGLLDNCRSASCCALCGI